MFVYKPTLNVLDLKKTKEIIIFSVENQMGVYSSKRKSLYTAFLDSINFSGYRIRIKFDKDSLVVEQKITWSKL